MGLRSKCYLLERKWLAVDWEVPCTKLFQSAMGLVSLPAAVPSAAEGGRADVIVWLVPQLLRCPPGAGHCFGVAGAGLGVGS